MLALTNSPFHIEGPDPTSVDSVAVLSGIGPQALLLK